MLIDIKKVRTSIRCLILLTFASPFWCKSSDKVSLSWRINEDHLRFSCDVKNLSLGVTFEDPHGNIRGHCTAPIPHTVAGHCDSHLKQNIFSETTELTVDMLDGKNGLWKCSHGENTNEYATASVSVSIDSTNQLRDQGKVNVTVSIWQRYECIILPLWIGYAVSHILILIYSFRKVRQNVKGTDHVNVWWKQFLKNEIVIPSVIFHILPLFLMNFTDICKAEWCILVGFVGVIITVSFKLLQDKCIKDTEQISTPGHIVGSCVSNTTQVFGTTVY